MEKKKKKEKKEHVSTHTKKKKRKEKNKLSSNGCQYSVVTNEALINPFIERTAHFFQRIKSELTTKNTQPLF